jgi:hypothetical protein
MLKLSTLVGLTLFALASPASAGEAAPSDAKSPSADTEKAPGPAAAEAPAAPAIEVDTTAQPPESKRKLQVALSFLPMAMGKYEYSQGPLKTVSADAAFAYGVSLSVGYEVLSHLVVGLAPQVISNVKEKAPTLEDAETSKEIDLMARVTYLLPVGENTVVYAEFLPGYSLIRSAAAPNGLVMAFGAGVAIELTDRFFVNVGGGYQLGFQKWKEGANTYDTRTKFVRVALGGGVKF